MKIGVRYKFAVTESLRANSYQTPIFSDPSFQTIAAITIAVAAVIFLA